MKKQTLYFKKILSIFIFLFISNTCQATLHKDLWSKWLIFNPLSNEVIDHQLWQDFLSQHVKTNNEGIHLIDYPNIHEKELKILERYIRTMSTIPIQNYNRNEQLAFWINLYNALTVSVVARYYPVDSIQEIDISPGLFSIGPWGANLITVANTPLSLDDILNRIIRPIWNDPRTFYAINDASIGAPNLSQEAYKGNTLSSQLNTAAFSYINSLRGVQIIDNQLITSKIYDWYIDDFGGKEELVISHIELFADKELRKKLLKYKKINGYIYNWHLNTTVVE